MRETPQGFLLITVLMILTGLATLMTVGLTRSMGELVVASNFATSQQVYYRAEAGLDCAVSALESTSDRTQVGIDCSNPAIAIVGPGVTVVTVGALAPNRLLVTSTHTTPGVQETINAVLARSPTSPFQQAIYGTGEVSNYYNYEVVDTSYVDSYKSEYGSYAEYVWELTGPNILANGDVYTNSDLDGTSWTGDEALMLTGYSTIHGDAYTAPGGVVNPASAVTGVVGERTITLFSLPDVPDPPTGCTHLGNLLAATAVVYPDTCYTADEITVTGAGQMNFPNLKELYVSGDINVLSGATLKVGQGTIRVAIFTVENAGSLFEGTDGLVEIYTTKQWVINDQAEVLANQNLPEQLRVYSSSGMPSVVRQGSMMYGTVYAPHAWFSVAIGSTFYGAIISRRGGIREDSSVHYDESLKTATGWPQSMNQATVRILAQY